MQRRTYWWLAQRRNTWRGSMGVLAAGAIALGMSVTGPILADDQPPGRKSLENTMADLAATDNPFAQYRLGYLYSRGSSTLPRDPQRAYTWYRLAAEKGLAIAQNEIGVMANRGEGTDRDDALAAQWYRRAADQGLAVAARNLGALFDRGEGVAQDRAQALTWYLKAAERDEPALHNRIGALYDAGDGTAPDPQEAARWYRRAAEREFAPAQRNLARLYELGRGVPADPEKAQAIYEQAAGGGDAAAARQLGQLMRRGNLEQQNAAFGWTEQAAKAGDAAAQRDLAGLYYRGDGTEQDYDMALTWYQRAAERGDAAAASDITVLFPPPEPPMPAKELAPLVEPDPAPADATPSLASEDPPKPAAITQVVMEAPVAPEPVAPVPSTTELMVMDIVDEGPPMSEAPVPQAVSRSESVSEPETSDQDTPEIEAEPTPVKRIVTDSGPADRVTVNSGPADRTIADLMNGARAGGSQDQIELGRRYEIGEGVNRDPARAALWYGRAAEQGNAFAQSSLGYMYMKGDGVPRDTVQAHKWFSLAADQNYATAADARDAIANAMAPDEIESAKRLAEGWLAAHGAPDTGGGHGLGAPPPDQTMSPAIETPVEPEPLSTMQSTGDQDVRDGIVTTADDTETAVGDKIRNTQ